MRFTILLCLVLFVVTFAKQDLYVRKAPRWSAELPDDTAYIYGVGMATVKGDLAIARKKAEQDALLKVSQSLKSVIKGHVKSKMSTVVNGGETKISDQYDEAIELFTQNTLTDCKIIKAAIVKKEKTYWVLAALDKEAYDKRMNKHFYDAVAIATEALKATYPVEASGSVSFLSVVNRLEQGLDAVGRFWGVPMKAVVNGREVVLNVAIPQRFEELFSELSLKSSVNGVVQYNGGVEDPVGVFIEWGGRPVSDLSLRWEANTPIAINDTPNKNGFVKLDISYLNAGDGVVTLKAMPDVNSLVWKLKNKGVSIVVTPTAEIRVQAAPKEVYVVFGADTRDFVNWLTSNGEAVLSQSGTGMELTLTHGKAKLSRGLYHVRSTGVLKLQGAQLRVERIGVTGVGRTEAEAMEQSKETLYKKLLSVL